MGAVTTGSVEILDWRRRTFALYAEIRARVDPASAYQLWCATRAELLSSHPASPVALEDRAAYPGPRFAPYDPGLRFEAELDSAIEPRRLEVPTGTDGVVPFQRMGCLHLPGVGDLDVWWLVGYGGGVFVPLKDALAGSQTYGGGRYVLDSVKGADLGGEGKRLVVDLNFAYNPSCAYDPAWACPLAPPGNVVKVPIRAGELYAP